MRSRDSTEADIVINKPELQSPAQCRKSENVGLSTSRHTNDWRVRGPDNHHNAYIQGVLVGSLPFVKIM